jgi:glycosyltransferase involved in cell wall biosynthesis
MNIPKVSIVMPVYNEAKHIEKLVSSFYRQVYLQLPRGSEFIIAEDGSNDGTNEVLDRLKKKMKITVVHGGAKKGYSKAAKDALKLPRNNVIFFTDSSGKHKPDDFWKLANELNNADIITGLRSDRKDPFFRRILTVMQRVLISVIFLIPFYDFNTGFKLIKKEVLDKVLKDCRYLKYGFSAELLIRAYKSGFSIKNVSVGFVHRDKDDEQFALKKIPKILIQQMIGFVKLRYELLNGKILILF